MELPGKRKQGRPKTRFVDAVREDMVVVKVTEEDAEDRNNGDGKSDGRSQKKKNKKELLDKKNA